MNVKFGISEVVKLDIRTEAYLTLKQIKLGKCYCTKYFDWEIYIDMFVYIKYFRKKIIKTQNVYL